MDPTLGHSPRMKRASTMGSMKPVFTRSMRPPQRLCSLGQTECPSVSVLSLCTLCPLAQGHCVWSRVTSSEGINEFFHFSISILHFIPYCNIQRINTYSETDFYTSKPEHHIEQRAWRHQTRIQCSIVPDYGITTSVGGSQLQNIRPLTTRPVSMLLVRDKSLLQLLHRALLLPQTEVLPPSDAL